MAARRSRGCTLMRTRQGRSHWRKWPFVRQVRSCAVTHYRNNIETSHTNDAPAYFASGLTRYAGRIFPTVLCALAMIGALVVTSRWFAPGYLFARGDTFPITLLRPDLWIERIHSAWD